MPFEGNQTQTLSNNISEDSQMEYATFGLGCFWCAEGMFSTLRGVHSVQCGYSGGKETNFTYEDVKQQKTSHIEVVEILFDKNIITYEQLLNVFWNSHDFTQEDGQGEDIGTQYQSVIFYYTEEQRIIAEKTKLQQELEIQEMKQNDFFKLLAKYKGNKVITDIRKMENFYESESYHNNYCELNPENQYCQDTVIPKLQKFIKNNQQILKDTQICD